MRRIVLLALHVALTFAFAPALGQRLLPDSPPPTGPPVWSADGTVDIDALEALLEEQAPHNPVLGEALQRLEQAPDASRDAHYYWVWARLYTIFDVAKGQALLDRAVREHPSDVRLQALRMSYAVRYRCKECADAVIESMKKLAPDHPLTQRTIGLYQQQFFKDHESAVAHFERAIPGQPAGNLSWTYALLGESYGALGRHAESVRAWKTAAELAPRSPGFLAEYAVALTHGTKDFALAESVARRALALRPNERRAQHALIYSAYARWAAAYERAGDSPDTQRLFDEATALENDLSEVFKHACGFQGSTDISIAFLKAKKVDYSIVNEPDGEGRTCLLNIIALRDPKLVRLVIGLGGDIDAQDNNGRTLLMRAIAKNDQETFDLLMELGADVNAVGVGGSALSWAATFPTGTLAMAKRLLDAKADPNAVNAEGFTPLHEAALKLNVELAQLLLERGARVDAEAIGGMRPLGWAVTVIVGPGMTEQRRVEMVRLLLDHGADAKRMQGKMWSPLDAAQTYHPELVPMLER